MEAVKFFIALYEREKIAARRMPQKLSATRRVSNFYVIFTMEVVEHAVMSST